MTVDLPPATGKPHKAAAQSARRPKSASLYGQHVARFSVEEPEQVRLLSGRARPVSVRALLAPPQVNEFTKLVERTVDSLRSGSEFRAEEVARRILESIRHQYDEVHYEADKREAELASVRAELKLLEANPKTSQDDGTHPLSPQHFEEVSSSLRQASELHHVYEHLLARLTREVRIIRQKVSILETHLARKTAEVRTGQELSRRVHRGKVEAVNKLEALEEEMNMERRLCNSALDDLQGCADQQKHEVQDREDFERWRYGVALDAAREAFELTASRFRKIYAIEKLTGNCLQKITFEQAEHSQSTENGFQRIREVTGLTEVIDIVQKFQNGENEHDTLCQTVRETEVRLHNLREAEASRRSTTSQALDGPERRVEQRSLRAEMAEQESLLQKVQRDHEDLQREIRKNTQLLDNIVIWSSRISRFMAGVESFGAPDSTSKLPSFFSVLQEVLERFFANVHQDTQDAKLAKLSSQAGSKEFAEQQKLLTDKDFLRVNCRVPGTREQALANEVHHQEGSKKKHHHHGISEEERQENEVALDRERIKLDSRAKLGERGGKPTRGFDRSQGARTREVRNGTGRLAAALEDYPPPPGDDNHANEHPRPHSAGDEVSNGGGRKAARIQGS